MSRRPLLDNVVVARYDNVVVIAIQRASGVGLIKRPEEADGSLKTIGFAAGARSPIDSGCSHEHGAG